MNRKQCWYIWAIVEVSFGGRIQTLSASSILPSFSWDPVLEKKNPTSHPRELAKKLFKSLITSISAYIWPYIDLCMARWTVSLLSFFILSHFIFSPFCPYGVLSRCALPLGYFSPGSSHVLPSSLAALWLVSFPTACSFLSGSSDLAQKTMLGALPEHCLCRGNQVLITAGEINVHFLFLTHSLSVKQEVNQAQPVLRCLLTFSSCAFLICLCSLFPPHLRFEGWK